MRDRVIALLGLTCTLAMLFLGGVWLTTYTVLAIPVLPAPLLFLMKVLRPGRKLGRCTRDYLVAAVAVSITCFIMELDHALSRSGGG